MDESFSYEFHAFFMSSRQSVRGCLEAAFDLLYNQSRSKAYTVMFRQLWSWYLARQARHQLERRRFSRAEALASRAVQVNPTNALAYFWRGSARYYMDQYEGAVRDLSQAVRHRPDHADAYFQRAIAHHERGDLEAALGDYDRTIELAGDNASYFYIRGHLHAQRANFAAALHDFNAALALNPWLAPAYKNRAQAHAILGDFQAAARDLDQVLEQLPGDAHAMLQRGHARRQTGDADGAADDFEQGINQLQAQTNAPFGFRWLSQEVAVPPRSALYYLLGGVMRYEFSDYGGAVDDFGRVIDLRFDHLYSAYYWRGTAYLALEDLEAAIADFSAAIAHQPNRADYYALRGRLYARQGHLAVALDDLNEAIQRGGDPEDYHMRARVWLAQGDPARAVRDSSRALDAGIMDALITRGEAHRRQGHLDRARADFTDALWQGETEGTLLGLGLVELERGDPATAVQMLRAAPPSTAARAALAVAMLALGDTDAARRQWAAVVAEDGRFADVEWASQTLYWTPQVRDLAGGLSQNA